MKPCARLLCILITLPACAGESPVPGFDGLGDTLDRFLRIELLASQVSLWNCWDMRSPPKLMGEEGRSPTMRFVEKSFEEPAFVRLALWEAINRHACKKNVGTGGGSGGPRRFHYFDTHCDAWRASVNWDPDKHTLALHLAETKGKCRSLDIESAHEGATIIRFNTEKTRGSLQQSENGEVTLWANINGSNKGLSAPNFHALLALYPDESQMHLMGPLAELGVRFALKLDDPTVLLAALTGFSLPDSALQYEVERVIERLGSTSGETRDAASREAQQLYPRAIFSMLKAARESNDAEVRMRLNRVMGARGDLHLAREYVGRKNLHLNVPFLFRIFQQKGSLAPAARTRLTQVLGIDYGPDPAQWPIAEKAERPLP